MAQQREDRGGPDPITIFVLMSIVFVAVAMIAFAALFLIGRVNSATTSQQNLTPYNLFLRPVPNAERAVDLLAEQLGPFKRGPVTGTIQSFSATYTNGKDKVDISGSRAVSFHAAQAEVGLAEHDSQLANVLQRQLNQDPSFILTGGPAQVRFIWSHERWMFDVKASSQAALDAFMKVFVY